MTFVELADYECMTQFGDAVDVLVFESFEEAANAARGLFGVTACVQKISTPFDGSYSMTGELNGFPLFRSTSGLQLSFQDSWTFSDPSGELVDLIEVATVRSIFPIANQTWTDGTIIYNDVDLVPKTIILKM